MDGVGPAQEEEWRHGAAGSDEDHGDSSDQERSPLWPHARHFCGAPFPGVIGNCICRSEMLSFRFYVEIERLYVLIQPFSRFKGSLGARVRLGG